MRQIYLASAFYKRLLFDKKFKKIVQNYEVNNRAKFIMVPTVKTKFLFINTSCYF